MLYNLLLVFFLKCRLQKEYKKLKPPLRNPGLLIAFEELTCIPDRRLEPQNWRFNWNNFDRFSILDQYPDGAALNEIVEAVEMCGRCHMNSSLSQAIN